METHTFIISSANKKFSSEVISSMTYDIPFSRNFRNPDQMYKLRSEFISTTAEKVDKIKLFIEITGLTNYNKFDTSGNKGNALILGVAKPVFITEEFNDYVYFTYTCNESVQHKMIAPSIDTIQVKMYSIEGGNPGDIDYQLILHFDPI